MVYNLPETVAYKTADRLPDNRDKKLKDKKDAGFWTLFILMLAGVFAMLIISIFVPEKKSGGGFGPVFGLSITLSLAAAFCGGFLGFLFGIPRSLQKKSSENGSATTNGTNLNERSYGNNTNLEEISDWLTKIIVGVSLTQLPSIERRFHVLTLKVSQGFIPHLKESLAYPYAGALLVFFALCGFFAVYLWSRIYLFEILNIMDKALASFKNKVDAVDVKVAGQENARLLKIWEDRKLQFEKQRNRIITAESEDSIKKIIAEAKPAPVTILDDCQQKRWIGDADAGKFKVTASFSQNPNETEYYDVTITVQPAEAGGKGIQGNVYFFMQDSFYPNIIATVTAIGNKAEYKFTCYEAFTVGIVLNEGRNKLELDLNTYPQSPDDSFRYTEPLYSYEQIKEEIKKLGG